MPMFNDREVRRSLGVLQKIDALGVRYRVLGSLLVAALEGQLHREIGDVDLLTDREGAQAIKALLEAEGFTLVTRKAFGFSWCEAYLEGCIHFTLLLVGDFCQTHFSYPITRWTRLTISSSYLSPTSYALFGISFVGIPLSSVYEGICVASLHPKRRKDRQIVGRLMKAKEGKSFPTLAKSFRVYLGRIKIPYLYVLFSSIHNLIGGFRVFFGKKYDVFEM